jgi:hypothetical protein
LVELNLPLSLILSVPVIFTHPCTRSYHYHYHAQHRFVVSTVFVPVSDLIELRWRRMSGREDLKGEETDCCSISVIFINLMKGRGRESELAAGKSDGLFWERREIIRL